jgi:hypothetical protein
VLGQHDDADPGAFASDGMGGLDALHVVAGRHPDGGQYCLWSEPPDRVAQLFRVADGGDDVDLAWILGQPAGALANEVVVLGEDDPQRVRHRLPRPAGPRTRWFPPPGRPSTRKRPPSASTRPCRLVNP